MRKRGLRTLACALFVAWKAAFPTEDVVEVHSVFFYPPGNLTNALIVRTVWPSEVDIVVEDIVHVKSFYTSRHEELRRNSRAHCDALKGRGYAARLDPHVNGSQSFPNHILCNSDDTTTENNYLTVRADFMLFAKNATYVEEISRKIDASVSDEMMYNSHHNVDIDVEDVSEHPKKLLNWFMYCTEERLDGYDYVWFMDGDVSLKSLNWGAFFQQVKLMRPKITQAAMIGTGPDQMGTIHDYLRHKSDSRLLAAEVPMVEIQSPLLEVDTWLGYRRILIKDPEVMEPIQWGGESCFDMAWCKYAGNYTGQGPIRWQDVGYRETSPIVSLDQSDIKGRGCIVLYQTPIVNTDKQTLAKALTSGVAHNRLCSHFRLDMGVVGKNGVKTVWELFNAPKT